MKLRALLSVSSLALLCACTVGPNFTPPKGPRATAYLDRADRPLPAHQRVEMTSAIAHNWWTTFRNNELNQLITTALAANPTIAAARARLAAASEQVNQAAGAMLPQLALSGTVGRQQYGAALFGPANFNIPPFTYYSVGPEVAFPLDLFGGQRRQLEEQTAFARYRAFELDAADLSVAAEVTAQTLSLAAASAQLRTLDEIIAADRRDVELVKIARKAGSANRTQLLSVESQLALDRTLLPPLRQQQSAARHGLAILLGKTPSAFTAPAFRLQDFTLPHTLRIGVPSALVHDRPDILAAEAQLHAASAAIGVATANLYPKIDLTANVAQEALTPGGLFNSVAAAWSMAANLSQPLFDGGQLSAARRAAIDSYKAALAQYRQTILSAFAQVSDRLEALANDAEEVRAQRAATQTALASRNLARRSYSVGYSGILDVIDAERQAARAELGLSRAKTKQLMDTAALYEALGAPGLVHEAQEERSATAMPS
ncbi:MAG: efflux transporter outer membrane subunit, partial [Alphaproteobacteria bacterium]|nr:efflux transporter outer membrane subunit [Alphaproteobacteria bacterium]